MRPGLERISKILDRLGHPEETYSSIIVAGTNGKGSVAAMIEAALRSASIRAGLYTSPHLVRPEERICVGGSAISEKEFARTATRIINAVEHLLSDGEITTPPSFFEFLSAMAFDYFRDQRVELAVLEVGMGGRLDATNAAPAFLTVVTSIDFDHEKHLGITLQEIAGEKAATIKPGCHAVVGPQSPEARAVVLERCHRVGVEPVLMEREGRGAIVKCVDQDGHRLIDLPTSEGLIEGVTLGLRGAHQVENAIAAAEACIQLRALGWNVSEANLREGLAAVKWPGRLELLAPRNGTWPVEERGSAGQILGQECLLGVTVSREKQTGNGEGGQARACRTRGPALLLDGAHNPAAARVLRASLEELRPPHLTLLFGVMRDKKIDAIVRELFPLADQRVLTRVDDERAADLSVMQNLADKYGEFTWSETPEEALRAAIEMTSADGLICVTGSLYLVGAVKALLQEQERGESDLEAAGTGAWKSI